MSKKAFWIAALSACMATNAWSDTTATLGPVVISIQDLTPDDGVAPTVLFSNQSGFGYVAHQVDGEDFTFDPFAVVPGSASASMPGVYGASAVAGGHGWTTSSFMASGHGGFVGGSIE